MRKILLPLFFLVACGGEGGGPTPAEDTALLDTTDLVAADTISDLVPDVPPEIAPEVALEIPPESPPDIPEGCPDGEHDGGDGTCVPEGTCAAGHHDGGDGICIPEDECAHGFWDGGDGACVPEGTCSEGYHDGGLGACLPQGVCSPGFFSKGSGGAADCEPELVLSDPDVGGALPAVVWDGTGLTVLWYGPGDPGAWMKIRMTFDAQILGTPALQATDVVDPGVLVAIPVPSGLIAVWEQSGGILRCMRVQADGSSTTTTLATDARVAPGEAWTLLSPVGDGALVTWVDQSGAPVAAVVDDACQPGWGPVTPPLPDGETVLGPPAAAEKNGVYVVGWPADGGDGEGFSTVLAYDADAVPGEAQAWQDAPGVVEEGLRLFPKTLGFGFFGLTLAPFEGGTPTAILRDLDGAGLPKAAPLVPLPAPGVDLAEPWAVSLTDDVFTLVWYEADSGSIWLAAFTAEGTITIAPKPLAAHGPDASLTFGPAALARVPGVGHAVTWSSALSGQDEVYVAIVDNSGQRLH